MSNATGLPRRSRPVLEWKPAGTDPRLVRVRLRPTLRSASEFLLVRSVITLGGGALLLWIFLSAGPGNFAAAFLPLSFALSISAVDWALTRRNVRVDPYGLTVSNTFRRHRIAWADVDDITIDGYESVTVLARDRVVTCRALTCAEWPRFPLGLERRRAIRAELASAATWLLGARDHNLART